MTRFCKEQKKTRLHGFRMDIVSPKSVLSYKMLRRICGYHNLKAPKLREAYTSYSAFKSRAPSHLAKLMYLFATTTGIPGIQVNVDVVLKDIPVLLGMEVLNRESFIANSVAYKLTKRYKFSLSDGTKEYADE